MNFESRHIGPDATERSDIARLLGYESNSALVAAVVPTEILQTEPLALAPAVSETVVLQQLREIAARNHVRRCVIGAGYYPTITPPIILRNVLENPAWYTAYTPYQPEISQGRLEALLNYQTLISELTGLDIANASLLDESTAIAEAVTMARRTAKSESNIVALHDDTHPQHIAVLRARCEPVGVEVAVVSLHELATIDAMGGVALITADHGNADEMFELDKKTKLPATNKDGSYKAKTAHTLNPVPLILYDNVSGGRQGLKRLETAGLSNIAATVANLVGLHKHDKWDDSLLDVK